MNITSTRKIFFAEMGKVLDQLILRYENFIIVGHLKGMYREHDLLMQYNYLFCLVQSMESKVNSISSSSQLPTELHEIVCASACEPVVCSCVANKPRI